MFGVTARRLVIPYDQESEGFDLSLLKYPRVLDEEKAKQVGVHTQ
jgi:hypothetical protein